MMNFEYDASQDVLSGERLTTAYRINQPSKTLRLNDAGFSEQTKQLKAEIHSNGTHDNIGMMHGSYYKRSNIHLLQQVDCHQPILHHVITTTLCSKATQKGKQTK